jgi:hypothetical protein
MAKKKVQKITAGQTWFTLSNLGGLSFLHSLGVVVYVAIVAAIMSQAETLFDGGDTMWAPVIMLLLLVLSVAIVGVLIFGRPIMLYIDGKRKEAMALILGTLGFLTFELLLILVIMVGLQS